MKDKALKVVSTAPKRIWLDLGFDPHEDEISFHELHEVTWSENNATGYGIEYVRVDTTPPYRKWVGLTGVEINHIFAANVGYPERMMKEVAKLLKEKNNG
jgi:transglutaminase-like putative cysteine protease